MKRFLSTLFVGVLAASLLFLPCNLNAQAKPKKIKIGTLAPDGSTWLNIIRDYTKKVEEGSGGEVKFIYYTGGVSGEEPDMLRKMKMGQLQAAGFSGMGLGIAAPAARVMELPFLYENYNEVDYVFEKIQGDLFNEFKKKGYIPLVYSEMGFVYLFVDKKIEKPSDLKTVKAWSRTGDELSEEIFFKALKGTLIPVNLPATEVLTSLQTGLINAFYGTHLVVLALQWYPYAKYVVDVPLINAIGVFVMNAKDFYKLSPKTQALLLKEGKLATKKMTQTTRRDNAIARQGFIEQGIKYEKPSPEVLEELKSKTLTVYTTLEGRFYSKQFLDKVIAYRDQARAQAKK
jgi:TRAP-type C4-dicarboxylate transport system substrate-binding protein